jgi:hypothetical protein
MISIFILVSSAIARRTLNLVNLVNLLNPLNPLNPFEPYSLNKTPTSTRTARRIGT